MKVQISFSTKCTANCRFCLKRILKEKYKFIEDIDMDLNLAKKILDQVDNIDVCGNRGEALLNKNIQEIFEYAKYRNVTISFYTNGYYKSEKWWEELGQLFNKETDRSIFGLDGINNETHMLHRKTNFNIVIRNMKAFIKGGGNATWKFIRFEHNQHQVEEARKLAKDIGCTRFDFLNSHTYNDILRKPEDDIVKVWTNENIKNESVTDDDYLPCRAKVYYINTKGILFPCCFVANVFGNKPLRIRYGRQDQVKLFDREKDLLDLRNNTIKHIEKSSQFFNEIIMNTEVCQNPCLKWTRNIIDERKEINAGA